MWLRAGFFVMACCSLYLFIGHARVEAGERPMCLGEPATIVGTRDHDDLYGTRGADVIVGRKGRDEIYGRGGNDIICAGDGRRVFGEFTVVSDFVDGGPGDDRISGGKGGDRLEGGTGHDLIHGGASSDSMNGDNGDDVMIGGVHQDELYASCGADFLSGGPGDDFLSAGRGNDRLSGNAGGDSLLGGDGDDRVIGGSGGDVALFWYYEDEGSCFSNVGDDPAERGSHVDLSLGLARGPSGRDALGSIENVTTDSASNGESRRDVLIGDNGPNVLFGGAGDDTLIGRAGADRFLQEEFQEGNNGDSDEYRGGSGNDIIETWEGSHLIEAGAGRDRLVVLSDCEGATVDLPGHEVRYPTCDSYLTKVFGIEDVLGDPYGSSTIIGSAGPNYLETGDGDDVISGGSGNDEIRAGEGNDELDGGTGTDLGDGDEGIDKCQGFERDMRCEL